MTTTTQRIEDGARVEGSYMGAKFTGTIRSHRQHTINYKVTMISVDLDAPVWIDAVGRTEESSLLIHTSYDGSPLDPSAGQWGDPGDYVKVIPNDAHQFRPSSDLAACGCLKCECGAPEISHVHAI